MQSRQPKGKLEKLLCEREKAVKVNQEKRGTTYLILLSCRVYRRRILPSWLVLDPFRLLRLYPDKHGTTCRGRIADICCRHTRNGYECVEVPLGLWDYISTFCNCAVDCSTVEWCEETSWKRNLRLRLNSNYPLRECCVRSFHTEAFVASCVPNIEVFWSGQFHLIRRRS